MIKKIKEIDELFNGYFIPLLGALGTITGLIVLVSIAKKIFLFNFWAGCLFIIIPTLIIWGIIHVLAKKDKKLKDKLYSDIKNDDKLAADLSERSLWHFSSNAFGVILYALNKKNKK